MLGQAKAIVDRLEKGLERFIRQPSGATEEAQALYTDNIRAFVRAKAKASEELAKVDKRVKLLEAALAELKGTPKPAAAAPASTAVLADEGNVRKADGFDNVVPASLKDLVDAKVPAAPKKSAFEKGTMVQPSAVKELIKEAAPEVAKEISEFDKLVPGTAADLLDDSELDNSATEDKDFDALKKEAGLGEVTEASGLRRLSAADSSTVATILFGDNSLAL